MKNCPHCDKPIQDEAILCRHCGKPVGPVRGARQKKCPFCAELIDASLSKCNICGSTLLPAGSAPAEAKPAPAPKPVKPAPAPKPPKPARKPGRPFAFFPFFLGIALTTIVIAICLLIGIEWKGAADGLLIRVLILQAILGICAIPFVLRADPKAEWTLLSTAGITLLSIIPVLNWIVFYRAGTGLARIFDRSRWIAAGIAGLFILFMVADFAAFRMRAAAAAAPAPAPAAQAVPVAAETGGCAGSIVDDWYQTTMEMISQVQADQNSISADTTSTTFLALSARASARYKSQLGDANLPDCLSGLQKIALELLTADMNVYSYSMLQANGEAGFYKDETNRLISEFDTTWADIESGRTSSAANNMTVLSGSDPTVCLRTIVDDWIQSTQGRMNDVNADQASISADTTSTTYLALSARANARYKAQKVYGIIPDCLSALQTKALELLTADMNVYSYSMLQMNGEAGFYRSEIDKLIPEINAGIPAAEAARVSAPPTSVSPSAAAPSSAPASAPVRNPLGDALSVAFAGLLLVASLLLLVGGYFSLNSRGRERAAVSATGSAPAGQKPAAEKAPASQARTPGGKPTAPEAHPPIRVAPVAEPYPPAPARTVPEKPAAPPQEAPKAKPAPAQSAPSRGGFHRYPEGGVCDVCTNSLEPGEGYQIPVDTFYSSKKYQQWLMNSPIGQMAIPMAGGIDAYIQKARSMDKTAYSVVCGDCVHLFE